MTDKTLEIKMKEADMASIDDLVKRHPINQFDINIHVINLKTFREWLETEIKEGLTLQKRLRIEDDSDLLEWTEAKLNTYLKVLNFFLKEQGSHLQHRPEFVTWLEETFRKALKAQALATLAKELTDTHLATSAACSNALANYRQVVEINYTS